MPIDFYETDENLVIKASLPGVNLKDVDICVRGDLLTISGEYKDEPELKKTENVCQERFTGKFSRTITLPEEVKIDKAEATMENGILTLTVPRCEESKPRSIPVKAGKPALHKGSSAK